MLRERATAGIATRLEALLAEVQLLLGDEPVAADLIRAIRGVSASKITSQEHIDDPIERVRVAFRQVNERVDAVVAVFGGGAEDQRLV